MTDKEKSAEEAFVEGAVAFLGVLFWLVSIPAITIYGGFVFMLVWNWFAPTFTPIRLTLPVAVGVMVLLTQIKGLRFPRVDDDKIGTQRLLAHWFWGDTACLVTAYVAHLFVR